MLARLGAQLEIVALAHGSGRAGIHHVTLLAVWQWTCHKPPANVIRISALISAALIVRASIYHLSASCPFGTDLLYLFLDYNGGMGRPRKDDSLRMDTDLRVPLTGEQKALLDEATSDEPQGKAAWARTVLLDAARKKIAKRKPRGKESG